MPDVEQIANLSTIGKQALIDLLNNLTQAKDFVLGQAPDVCQQYVALGRFECIVTFLAAIALGIFAWRFPLYVIGKYKAAEAAARAAGRYSTDEMGFAMLGVFPTLAAIAGTIVMLGTSWSSASAWIAPKIYLIRAISELIK